MKDLMEEQVQTTVFTHWETVNNASGTHITTAKKELENLFKSTKRGVNKKAYFDFFQSESSIEGFSQLEIEKEDTQIEQLNTQVEETNCPVETVKSLKKELYSCLNKGGSIWGFENPDS